MKNRGVLTPDASGLSCHTSEVRPRNRLILALVAACLGLFAATYLFFRSTEPAYHGNSLSFWIKTYNWPDNPTVNDLFPRRTKPLELSREVLSNPVYRERAQIDLERRKTEAAEAVRQIGTNAIPALLKGIDVDPASWRVALYSKIPPSLPGHRLVRWVLVDRTEQRIQTAITGFQILGAETSAAVPELSQRMKTRNSRSGWLSVLALSSTGPDGLKALAAELDDTNALNRVSVARIFGQAIRNSGTNTASFRSLAHCVYDHESGVATWSAITVGSLAIYPAISIPELTTGLQDARPQVRARCADALGQFGAAAQIASRSLRNLSNDPDPFVRAAATGALAKVAPEINSAAR